MEVAASEKGRFGERKAKAILRIFWRLENPMCFIPRHLREFLVIGICG